MSSCPEYSDHIKEYALGDIAELTPDEKAKLEAHIQECAECRADLEEWQNFLNLIRSPKELEVPQWVKESLPANVMKAIRRDALLRVMRRTAALAGIAAAAAALLVIGLVVSQNSASTVNVGRSTPAVIGSRCFPGSKPPEQVTNHQTAVVQDTPRENKSELTLEERLAAISDPSEALVLLQEEFTASKSIDNKGHLIHLVNCAKRVYIKWPDCKERADLLLFMARVYEHVGDMANATKCFLEYANELGRRAKRFVTDQGGSYAEADIACTSSTAGAIMAEAGRAFGERDFIVAFTYCDYVLSRYPGSDNARKAQYITARCYDETRQPHQAIELFQTVIKAAQDSSEAMNARTWLPSLQFNVGRQSEAIATWLEYSEKATNDNEKACGYCNAGVLTAARGISFYPDAIKLLEIVEQNYPTSNYAAQARAMKRKLLEEIIGVF